MNIKLKDSEKFRGFLLSCSKQDGEINEEGYQKLKVFIEETMTDIVDSQLNRHSQEEVQKLIAETCDEIKELLLEKNRNYGNAAIDPIRIFSKADVLEQINVRLDDKLSRLARGSNAGEDVELDLVGYIVLKRVAKKFHGITDNVGEVFKQDFNP